MKNSKKFNKVVKAISVSALSLGLLGGMSIVSHQFPVHAAWNTGMDEYAKSPEAQEDLKQNLLAQNREVVLMPEEAHKEYPLQESKKDALNSEADNMNQYLKWGCVDNYTLPQVHEQAEDLKANGYDPIASGKADTSVPYKLNKNATKKQIHNHLIQELQAYDNMYPINKEVKQGLKQEFENDFDHYHYNWTKSYKRYYANEENYHSPYKNVLVLNTKQGVHHKTLNHKSHRKPHRKPARKPKLLKLKTYGTYNSGYNSGNHINLKAYRRNPALALSYLLHKKASARYAKGFDDSTSDRLADYDSKKYPNANDADPVTVHVHDMIVCYTHFLKHPTRMAEYALSQYPHENKKLYKHNKTYRKEFDIIDDINAE